MSTLAQFRVVTRITGGRAVVRVEGEVDLYTGPRLRDALDALDALDDGLGAGAHRVEVDFARISFCDCSGLSVLIGARLRARKAGVCFGVSHVDAPAVKRLFALTGTGGILLPGSASA